MVLKFITVLCLIFSTWKNVSSFKAEDVSLHNKKLRSLINFSASDVLKANQGGSVTASLKNVENVFGNYSWNSSNYTELPQAYFEIKNVDINKEKGVPLSRNNSAFDVQFSSNTTNASLYGRSVNTTTIGENVQPKMIKTEVVGPSHKQRIITSSNDMRYTDMIETEPTKEPQRDRKARAKTESVQSIMDKLFGEDFSESGRNRQKQTDFNFPDGSRERSSRRRQKMKKPDRFDKGNVFYFRDAAESITPGNTTSDETKNTTTADTTATTASSESKNTTASEAATTASSESKNTTVSEAATTAPGGAKNTTAGDTESTATSRTANTASGRTRGTNTEKTVDGVTSPIIRSEPASPTPEVKFHYHFHFFGASPPPPPPGV